MSVPAANISGSPVRPAHRKRGSSISQALQAIPLNTQREGGRSIDPTPGSPDGTESPAEPLTAAVSAAVNEAPSAALGASQDSSSQTPPALQLNGSESSYLADQNAQSQLRQRKKASKTGKAKSASSSRPQKRKRGFVKLTKEEEERYKSKGFWDDLKTGKWMLIPSSAFVLHCIPIILYNVQRHILANPEFPNYLPANIRHALFGTFEPVSWSLLPKDTFNVWEAMIWPSHAVDKSNAGGDLLAGQELYKRGWLDLLFLSYHVIFFSLVRQTIVLYILQPLAKVIGIRGSKVARFTEQGYAIFYFGAFGSFGIYIMRSLPIWWYKTEPMWTTFPVLEMPRNLKVYYLLQASYWVQQTIILAARVEKPRNDFKELVAHHIVTLWLIGWSYLLTLTYIGVAIFVTMDVSDVFLALAKCVNYVSETWSVPFFAFFVLVWSYTRHYLNIKIMWSVWFEFDKIPEWARSSFRPWKETELLSWWMKYQIFAPIFLLQLINLFWYFLILRIMYRAIFYNIVQDERSDDEGDDGEDDEVEAEGAGTAESQKDEL